MNILSYGSTAMLKKQALDLPYMQDCINLKTGMRGRVIGMTSSGDKYAIEFEERIFSKSQHSYFDSGCHRKGRKGHCAYIPTDMMFGYVKDYVNPEEYWEPSKGPEVVGFIDLDSGLDNALVALL